MRIFLEEQGGSSPVPLSNETQSVLHQLTDRSSSKEGLRRKPLKFNDKLTESKAAKTRAISAHTHTTCFLSALDNAYVQVNLLGVPVHRVGG